VAGAKITIGDLEIETIDKVVVRVEDVWGGIVGVASKEPVAVIIRSPAGTRRVDLEHRDAGTTDSDLPPGFMPGREPFSN
jgi:hypothetical protein